MLETKKKTEYFFNLHKSFKSLAHEQHPPNIPFHKPIPNFILLSATKENNDNNRDTVKENSLLISIVSLTPDESHSNKKLKR